jgi:hypothetical protein
MRSFCSSLVFAVLVAGCNAGGGAPSSAGAPTVSAPSLGRGAHASLFHAMHTPPYPPPRHHVITARERARALAAGWQELAASPPFTEGAGTELLLTDGTVLVEDICTTNWFRLTPDENGNYQTGTWSQAASLPSGYAPLYFASAVLPDGKVIINGGEYNFCAATESNQGAIFDPVANTWKSVSPPSGWTQIGDGQSVVLANGTYMLGNCCTDVQALLNQRKMTWTQSGPGNGKDDVNSEEGWTLLRNGEVLVVNVSDPPYAQVYNPKANEWESAGELPVDLITGFEIGPQTLRPNDTVFVAGATGATAILNAKTGVWTEGPSFPIVSGLQLDVADGPSSLLVDGTVMIPASPGLYNAPTTFFLFNGKKLKPIAGPPNAPNDSTYNIRLLVLPTGQILETDYSGDVEVYTSNRRPEGRLAPEITSVPTTLAAGSTYTISGRRLNGFSQANMYGDDVQQATNFPLVRITNTSSSHVVYARTHNFSYMGVGSERVVSAKFDVPSSIGSGASSLVVVANGIASTPVQVTISGTGHPRR